MLKRLAATLSIAAALLCVLALPALAADVRITADGIEPASVTVAPGEEVNWVNETDAAVTLVAEDGSWDSGPIAPGERFALDLRRAGAYAYASEDGTFSGSVEVVEAGDAEAEPVEEAGLPRTGVSLLPALFTSGALLALGGTIILRTRRQGLPRA